MDRQHCWIHDDMIVRACFKNTELLRQVAYYVSCSRYCSWFQKCQLQQSLRALPVRSSIVQQRQRCRLTGRARFITRNVRLGRLFLRYFVGFGYFRGLRKAGN